MNSSKRGLAFCLKNFSKDTHNFGNNSKRLKNLLEAPGFKNIKEIEPQEYHIIDAPSLQDGGVKGNYS